MATAASAWSGISGQVPCKRSEQLLHWLFGLARTALRWTCIGLTVPLLLERLPEMGDGERALLITAFMLCIGAAVRLLLPAAEAVRDRS
jgi:hypothetical protein